MKLNARQIRRLNQGLLLTEILLVLAGIAVVGLVFRSRPALVTATSPTTAPATRPAAVVSNPALAWYAPIWTRDLRQPPIEPKPSGIAVAPQPAPPPPPPKIKLLGTVVEPGDCYGLFADEAGRLTLKRLDEHVGEYRVRQVERGKAQIEGPAGQVWLTMPDYDQRVRGDGSQ